MTQLSTRQDAPALHLPAPEEDAQAAAAPGRLADFAQLTKPRITLLVVITAYIGFALGVRALPFHDDWSWLMLVGMLAGTAMSCMGASAFNQVYERDTDGLMERTRHRPIPAGRMGLRGAKVAGAVLSVLGVLVLWGTTNGLAASASAFTILSYTLVYTPLKRVTTFAVWVGAVPGAMPPVIGYAAATESVGVAALLLFAIMFVWQVPHFLAIAWLYREDYGRAGLAMLPVVHPDGASTFRQILATCLALLPLGLLPTLMGVSGLTYFAVALGCGVLFLGCAAALVADPSRKRARILFFASLAYLPVVLGAMLLDAA